MGFAIVLVAEGDLPVLDGPYSRIRNRDAVRVATDVVRDLLRAGDGPFRIDHPVGLPHRHEVLHKRAPILQRDEGPEELERAGFERRLELREEQAAEEAREDADRQEPRATRDPAAAIRRQTAAWDDPVQVGMMRRVCLHVCRTAKKPISALKCLATAAIFRNVPAAARKRIP